MSDRYRTIVADPPWRIRDVSPGGGGGAGPQWGGGQSNAFAYPLMSLCEIAALPVADMATDDAHLYIWTVNAFVEYTYDVARAWGFVPSTLLTWAKPITGGGLGGTYRISTEHILFARRGSLRAKRQVGRTWFDWPRQHGHSRKPEAFMDMVELFARRNRLGWDTWGNEALGHVELAS
jgi:N6-adenosine-specific RNA methylase IME4